MDIAAIHVRFRLGGVTFRPPCTTRCTRTRRLRHRRLRAARLPRTSRRRRSCFTTTPSRGARRPPQGLRLVSPRREQRLAARRREAWRDIDPVATATAARPVVWHHSKLKRRDELAAAEAEEGGVDAKDVSRRAPRTRRAGGGGRRRGRHFEDDDVDALLQWSGALQDFDALRTDWLRARRRARGRRGASLWSPTSSMRASSRS